MTDLPHPFDAIALGAAEYGSLTGRDLAAAYGSETVNNARAVLPFGSVRSYVAAYSMLSEVIAALLAADPEEDTDEDVRDMVLRRTLAEAVVSALPRDVHADMGAAPGPWESWLLVDRDGEVTGDEFLNEWTGDRSWESTLAMYSMLGYQGFRHRHEVPVTSTRLKVMIADGTVPLVPLPTMVQDRQDRSETPSEPVPPHPPHDGAGAPEVESLDDVLTNGRIPDIEILGPHHDQAIIDDPLLGEARP